MLYDAPVFFTAPSGRTRLSLRRYTMDVAVRCSHPMYGFGHNAEVPIEPRESRYGEMCESGRGKYGGVWSAWEFAGDPRWPKVCTGCGYEFKDSDSRDLMQDEVYVRADGGLGEFSNRSPPVGMMWDQFWMEDKYSSVDGGPGWTNIGSDGLALAIAVPYQAKDGTWTTIEFLPRAACEQLYHAWGR